MYLASFEVSDAPQDAQPSATTLAAIAMCFLSATTQTLTAVDGTHAIRFDTSNKRLLSRRAHPGRTAVSNNSDCHCGVFPKSDGCSPDGRRRHAYRSIHYIKLAALKVSGAPWDAQPSPATLTVTLKPFVSLTAPALNGGRRHPCKSIQYIKSTTFEPSRAPQDAQPSPAALTATAMCFQDATAQILTAADGTHANRFNISIHHHLSRRAHLEMHSRHQQLCQPVRCVFQSLMAAALTAVDGMHTDQFSTSN